MILWFGPKKKKHKKCAAPIVPSQDAGKDWKTIAERWEKHNQSLQGQIEKCKMDQKKTLQEIDSHKSETKQMTERLALEKSWREKEQSSLEKAKAHEKEFKEQALRTESALEKEHSLRLRLEAQWQELKVKHEHMIEEKRQLAIKAASLQSTLEAHASQMAALRNENARLEEKRADIQWVAKSEFDELKKKLHG